MTNILLKYSPTEFQNQAEAAMEDLYAQADVIDAMPAENNNDIKLKLDAIGAFNRDLLAVLDILVAERGNSASSQAQARARGRGRT